MLGMSGESPTQLGLGPAPVGPGFLDSGTNLAGYRLISLLGRGGMGEVWLAELDGTMGMQKHIALKTLTAEIAGGALFRRLFLAEARLAARIAHPNVVPVHRIGEADGHLFYAMEWVDGDSLRAILRACRQSARTVPPGIAARIVADACLGLHAAHEVRNLDGVALGVVHRDVSPHNVLLTQDGIPRLIDFGIAKARALSDTTRPWAVLGKLEYMAPEQTADDVDRRVDVWSAGAVLYHMIAGRPVFERQVAQRRLAARARPKRLGAEAPAPLAAVIARALDPEREIRYPTALDFSLALEDALYESGLYATRGDVAAFAADLLGQERVERRARIARDLAAVRGLPYVDVSGRTPPPAPRALRPAANVAAADTRTAPPTPSADEHAASHSSDGSCGLTASLAAPHSRRRWLALAVLGAGVAVAVAVAIGASVRRSAIRPLHPVAAISLAAPAAPAPAQLTSFAAASPPSIVSPSMPPDGVPNPAATLSAEGQALLPVRGAPARSRSPLPQPRAERRPPPAAKAPDPCLPPYTVDEEGFRRYKMECL
jgi:serine/threonine-protein kinase